MRLALLSDIHGNSIALEAVLADIQARGGVDQYLFVGDYAAIGPDPCGVLERITALPHAQFVRGNTERFLVDGTYPVPRLDEGNLNLGAVRVLEEVSRSFGWTQGAVTIGGWYEWLAGLPLEYRTELPDGTRLLAVHSSPGHDDGPAVRPQTTADELRQMMAGCEADLVCVGHTHWPMDVPVDGVRVLNISSVSNPWPDDLRAKYALLEADRHGYRVQFRRVDYDRAAVIEQLAEMHFPAADYIEKFLRGQIFPEWWDTIRVNPLAASSG